MLAVRQLEMRRVCGHNANSTKPFFFIVGWKRHDHSQPPRTGRALELPGLRSVFRCCVQTCCSVAPTSPTAGTIELLMVEERSLTSRVLWDMLFGRTFLPRGRGYAAFAHRSCLRMCCTATMPHPTERYVQSVSLASVEYFIVSAHHLPDDNSNRPVCLQTQRLSRAHAVSPSQQPRLGLSLGQVEPLRNQHVFVRKMRSRPLGVSLFRSKNGCCAF